MRIILIMVFLICALLVSGCTQSQAPGTEPVSKISDTQNKPRDIVQNVYPDEIARDIRNYDGYSKIVEKDYDGAIIMIKKQLEEFPEDPVTLNNLGYALLSANRSDEAVEIFDTVLNNVSLQESAQKATTRKIDPSQTNMSHDEYYQHLIDRDTLITVGFNKAEALKRMGKIAESSREFENVQAKYTTAAEYYSILPYRINIADFRKQYDKAIDPRNMSDWNIITKSESYRFYPSSQILKKYTLLEPDNGDLLLQYAEMLAWERFFQESENYIQEVMEKEPENSRLPYSKHILESAKAYQPMRAVFNSTSQYWDITA